MNATGKHLSVRHSFRLKNYNYSQPGFYFLTLCVQHRLNLFGNFFESNLELNDAGKMVERWFFEMQNKYPNICCHEMVVMPNHFHCIIEITDAHAAVTDTDTAATDIDATVTDAHAAVTDAHVGAPYVGVRISRPHRNPPKTRTVPTTKNTTPPSAI